MCPATPVHTTAVNVTGAWDREATEDGFDDETCAASDLYAWTDDDGENGRLAHHDVRSDGTCGDANLAGCCAAIGELNSDDCDIPEEDRQGAWDHLAAHYRDAGVSDTDIPELNAQPDDNEDGTVGGSDNSTGLQDGTGSRAARARRAKKPRHRRGGLQHSAEVRLFAASGLEVRAADDGSDQIIVTGSPIVYNSPYVVRDFFGEFEETMLPGVASGVLAAACDCRFLLNHDGLPMARTLAGTMTLTDTDDALTFEAGLDSRQQLANDFAIAVERGDISQMSCAFIVAANGDSWNDDYTQRSISLLADLLDVSGVTYPASPTTSIAVAQRMMIGAGVEPRARLRRLYGVTRDLREGKTLSKENADSLATALEALHKADDTDIPGIVSRLQDIDAAADEGPATAVAAEPTPEPAPGTDERGIPATADARRAASLSFDDQRGIVYAALVEHLGDQAEDDDGYVDIWVCDLGDDWVVYESWCDVPGMFRLAYAIDEENVVTFTGDPEPVNLITSYEPLQPSADEPADAEPTARSNRASLELELELMTVTRRRGRPATTT